MIHRRSASPVEPNSSPITASVGRTRASRSRTITFHRAVGFGDGSEIRFGVDDEVDRAKARQRDPVSGVGELEGEREIGVDAGGM